MERCAKYRAYVYLFQFMKRVKRIHIVKKHRDSYCISETREDGKSPTLKLVQHCAHCQCDPREEWNPPDDHIYETCLRRGEIQHGTYFVKQLHLLANGNCYNVCSEFFMQTFGLSTWVYKHLVKHIGKSILPKERFTRSGSVKTNREQLVRQYI